MNKAKELLLKQATDKHKGIFYYINKRRRRGEKPPKKSATEWLQIKRAIRIAKSKVSSRRQGSKAR